MFRVPDREPSLLCETGPRIDNYPCSELARDFYTIVNAPAIDDENVVGKGERLNTARQDARTVLREHEAADRKTGRGHSGRSGRYVHATSPTASGVSVRAAAGSARGFRRAL
jgi:hypothetical protein